MSSIFDGEDTIVGVLWILSELGAVAWGLLEFANYNLVVEAAAIFGGSSGLIETVLFGAIAIAGGLALLDSLGVYDMADVVTDVIDQ